MSKIVIKKRVSLAFLGDEYKEAELVFKSIPLSDYDKFIADTPKSNPELIELAKKVKLNQATPEEQERLTKLSAENSDDSKKSLHMIMSYLKEYFISGNFPNTKTGVLESVEASDLDGLDQEAAIHCFETLTGQADPKEVSLSPAP